MKDDFVKCFVLIREMSGYRSPSVEIVIHTCSVAGIKVAVCLKDKSVDRGDIYTYNSWINVSTLRRTSREHLREKQM